MSKFPDQDANCATLLDKIDFILRVEPIAEGVDQIEPLLEDLLQHILQRPECQGVLEVRFEKLLDEVPPGALEVLQFTMHSLRWTPVREYAQYRLSAEGDITKRRLLEWIIDSFKDDWNDRDLYRRYRESMG